MCLVETSSESLNVKSIFFQKKKSNLMTIQPPGKFSCKKDICEFRLLIHFHGCSRWLTAVDIVKVNCPLFMGHRASQINPFMLIFFMMCFVLSLDLTWHLQFWPSVTFSKVEATMTWEETAQNGWLSWWAQTHLPIQIDWQWKSLKKANSNDTSLPNHSFQPTYLRY